MQIDAISVIEDYVQNENLFNLIGFRMIILFSEQQCQQEDDGRNQDFASITAIVLSS